MKNKDMQKKMAEDTKVVISELDDIIDATQRLLVSHNMDIIKEVSTQADKFISELSINNIANCPAEFIERAGEVVGLFKLIKRIAEEHKDDEN